MELPVLSVHFSVLAKLFSSAFEKAGIFCVHRAKDADFGKTFFPAASSHAASQDGLQTLTSYFSENLEGLQKKEGSRKILC